MTKIRQILTLFVEFLQFGTFTFGGGWSIIAQMRSLYVERKGILSNQELLDIVSIGRSIPGIMISNVAMLFGYRVAGLWGGFACVLGMVLPPLLILTLITFFYDAFRTAPLVVAAMGAIRAAIVPIMLSAVVNMVKDAFQYPPCILIAVVCFLFYFFYPVNCIWLVIGGAITGIFLSELYEHRRPMS